MVKVVYTVGRFQPPTIGHKSLIQAVIDRAKMEAGGKAYVFVSSTTTTPLKNPLTSGDKLPILEHMFPGDDVTFVNTADCKNEEGWMKSCGGAKFAFDYLTQKMGYKPEDITLVVGDDHRVDFGPGADTWNQTNTDGTKTKKGPGGQPPKEANFKFLKSAERKKDLNIKDAANMSGTKAREYVKLGRKEDFYIAVGYDTEPDKKAADAVYNKIKTVLAEPAGKLGKRKAGGPQEPTEKEETGTSADAEFDYTEEEIESYKRAKTAGRRKTRRLKRNKASGKALYRRGSRSRTGSSKTSRS